MTQEKINHQIFLTLEKLAEIVISNFQTLHFKTREKFLLTSSSTDCPRVSLENRGMRPSDRAIAALQNGHPLCLACRLAMNENEGL